MSKAFPASEERESEAVPGALRPLLPGERCPSEPSPQMPSDGTALSKPSQDVGVHQLSVPLSRGFLKLWSSGTAWNYRGVTTVGLRPTHTYLGSMGTRERKAMGEVAGPLYLPAHSVSSTKKQTRNGTPNLQSLLDLLCTRLSLGGQQMGMILML